MQVPTGAGAGALPLATLAGGRPAHRRPPEDAQRTDILPSPSYQGDCSLLRDCTYSFQSTIMKVRDDGKKDVKAANKLLREIDWEEEKDKEEEEKVSF